MLGGNLNWTPGYTTRLTDVQTRVDRQEARHRRVRPVDLQPGAGAAPLVQQPRPARLPHRQQLRRARHHRRAGARDVADAVADVHQRAVAARDEAVSWRDRQRAEPRSGAPPSSSREAVGPARPLRHSAAGVRGGSVSATRCSRAAVDAPSMVPRAPALDGPHQACCPSRPSRCLRRGRWQQCPALRAADGRQRLLQRDRGSRPAWRRRRGCLRSSQQTRGPRRRAATPRSATSLRRIADGLATTTAETSRLRRRRACISETVTARAVADGRREPARRLRGVGRRHARTIGRARSTRARSSTAGAAALDDSGRRPRRRFEARDGRRPRLADNARGDRRPTRRADHAASRTSTSVDAAARARAASKRPGRHMQPRDGTRSSDPAIMAVPSRHLDSGCGSEGGAVDCAAAEQRRADALQYRAAWSSRRRRPTLAASKARRRATRRRHVTRAALRRVPAATIASSGERCRHTPRRPSGRAPCGARGSFDRRAHAAPRSALGVGAELGR